MKRLFILGTSGSGKSYLAKLLSKKLKIKRYDLDDIFWIKKYTKKREENDCKKKLAALLQKHQSWIIEGIYAGWTKNAMEKADSIIYINTPLRLRAYRILMRYLKNKNKKEDETLSSTLTLIRYSRAYSKRKGTTGLKQHLRALRAHKQKVLTLRTKKDLEELLSRL